MIRYIKLLAMFLLAFLLVNATVYAAGDAAIPQKEVTGWWVGISGEIAGWVANALMVGFTALLGLIFGRKWNESTYHEAIEALRTGVEHAEVELARQYKEAAKDGVLTKDEIRALQDAAIAKAKEVAKGPALSLLKGWGQDYLRGLVSRIVEARKKKDTVLPPEVK